jgi:WD40-like Beta Propeller Repeat
MHQSLWRWTPTARVRRPSGTRTSTTGSRDSHPDGRAVVFTRIDPANDFWYTPMIRDLETGAERIVTPDDREPEHPQWSPDGRSIIYNTLHAAGDPDVPLELIEQIPAVDAAAEPVLLYAPPGGGLGAAKPTYSPDGSRILFGCSMAMCLMNADGSNVSELLRVPSAELNHFAWGPAR